jgi:hypothetical protein
MTSAEALGYSQMSLRDTTKRLCANENIPDESVRRLCQAGHGVVWIRETTPGSLDDAVVLLLSHGARPAFFS